MSDFESVSENTIFEDSCCDTISAHTDNITSDHTEEEATTEEDPGPICSKKTRGENTENMTKAEQKTKQRRRRKNPTKLTTSMDVDNEDSTNWKLMYYDMKQMYENLLIKFNNLEEMLREKFATDDSSHLSTQRAASIKTSAPSSSKAVNTKTQEKSTTKEDISHNKKDTSVTLKSSSSIKKVSANINDEHILPNTDNTQTNNNPAPNFKPPPLICYNINTQQYRDLIKKDLKHDKFYFKYINKNITHILTENKADFIKIEEILNNHKNDFYTYTTKDEKTHSYILKNLDHCFNAEEIYDAFTAEIERQNFQVKIIKVSRFQTPATRRNGKPGFWLIQLDNASNLNQFFSINKILNSIIKIEKLKKQEIMQCHKCQRFGHASINCGMKYRCVKCLELHEPGKCKTPSKDNQGEEKVLPSCVNCKGTDHPASYRNCPKYLEIKNRIAEKREQLRLAQVQKQQFYNNFRTPNISYAKVAAPMNSEPQPTAPILSNPLPLT